MEDKIIFGSSFWEFFKKIDFGDYDIVVDTQKRFLTTILLKRIRTKLFISTSCKQFFSDIPLAHKPEKNLSLSLVKLINLLSNKSFHFNYVHLSKNTRNVAICPGASTDIKRWKLNYFLEVGSFLIKKNFTPVFIIGPNEFEMIPLIKKSLKLSRIVKSIDPLKTIKISKNLFEPKHSILFRDNFNFCSALLKKNIFKKVGYFDVKKKHTQDYNMMFRIFKTYKPIILSEFLFFSRTHVKQNSKLFKEEAILEKEVLYLSKFKEIKFIFLKSNLFKKIYITFFLRDKDLKKITYNLIKLIKTQTGILYVILRTVILLNEILLFIKSR